MLYVSESRPLIMGHEASGTIHETGSAVTELKKGDRVAIEPGIPCRSCKNCKSGRYNLCPSMIFAACPPDAHGTLTKFYKLPADLCYKIPDSMSLQEAVLVEPLAVAVHATRLADVKVGMDVAIFGAGTVGLLCAAVARSMGAKRVVVIDVNAERLKFAESFAGTKTYQPLRKDPAEETASKLLEKHGLDDGVDVVLEATGVESCINAGIHALKAGGTFVQVGLGKQKIEFPIVGLSVKELRVMGCFRYGPGDYELAMHLLEDEKLSVKELISSIVPFEKATEAWEKTKKGEGIKNLINGVED